MVDPRQTKLPLSIGTGRIVTALLVLALTPVLASAHAKLLRSQPNAKETLSQSPKLIELWFTEALEPGLNTIEVKDQQGMRVDRGEVTLSEENKKAQVELNELKPGIYTVVWKTLSADQHAIRGRFTFTVEVSTAQASPTAGTGQVHTENTPMPDMSSDDDQGEQISSVQVLVRWLSYLAMMTLFGGSAFRLLVLVPSLRAALDAQERSKAVRASERRALTLSWISIALLAVTSFVALMLQAAAVFDASLTQSIFPSMLWRVLGTGYGPSWILQVVSLMAIAVSLWLLNRMVKRQPASEHSALWWVALLAGAGLLVAPSWTGHAVASAKDFRLAVFTDWLHLLAAGFWVGGLFHLALTLPPTLSLISKPRRTIAVHHFIKRFTRIAVPSVVLLVLAGLYNTWVHVPGIRALWGTPYGQALAVKLIVVGTMLLLGGLNNFHFGRRATLLLNGQQTASSREQAKLEQGFRRSVAMEAGLGVAVLLVTAVLVFLTPARNHPAMRPNTSQSTVLSSQR